MAIDTDRQIADTEATLTHLQTQLAQSLGMVERYREQAKRLNTARNDKPGVERAQQAYLSAQMAADTDRDSIADVEKTLASQIAARDNAIDKVMRLATGDEIAQRLRQSGEIERDGVAYFTRLKEWSDWAATEIPEMQGGSNFCIAATVQIPELLKLGQKLIGYRGSEVMAGRGSPTWKRQDVPVKPTVAIAPPPVPLFATRSIKWRDADGKQCIAQKFTDVELTPTAAARALSLNVAVQMSDPLRTKTNNTVAGHASLEYDTDLDVEPETVAQADPIRASAPPQFTVVDRGGPIKMKVARS